VITLSDDYKLVDKIEALGVPSLIDCASLTVKGPIHFEPGVIIKGDMAFENTGSTTQNVKAGVYQDQQIRF
jgi:hypothetical protein